MDEDDLHTISRTCPQCGGRMAVLDLPSQTPVLRCTDCGQVVI